MLSTLKNPFAAAPAAPLLIEQRAGRPPLLRAAADDDGDGERWVAAHREALRGAVLEHGALLVRGLGLRDLDGAAAVFRRLGLPLVEREAFAPRQRYLHGIYSSAKWPPTQPMCMHHEASYATEFPGLVLFACLEAPADGGATPLADAAAVLGALPGELVERCERVGWQLIRNYNGEIGATLAEAFGSDERAAVERYCRSHAICYEWLADGSLRTWQRRSAIVRHPLNGQRCWFNQIAFLNRWTLEAEVRDYLVELYGEDGLPFDTRFGDGAPIGPEIVQAINAAYAAHTVSEPWQPGDLLLVDNIRTAHGREPYRGTREVLVAMVDAVNLAACAPTIDVGDR